MEKSAYNPNYPQMPAQMTSAAGANEEMKNYPAPPSYDQATGSSAAVMAPYPPVQVLPPSQGGWATNNNVQQPDTHQPQPSQSSYPTHRHNPPTVIAPTQQYASYQGVPPTMQQPVVFIQQQTTLPLGPEPTYITCPACHIQKLTRIEYEPSSRTHLMAALLCILGLWCCVCLPYCAGSCMNANHYCGNCNKFLGTYGNGL